LGIGRGRKERKGKDVKAREGSEGGRRVNRREGVEEERGGRARLECADAIGIMLVPWAGHFQC